MPLDVADRVRSENPVRGEEDLRRFAWRIRSRALEMIAPEGFGYLGQALSAAEIFATVYGDAYQPGRDLLVLSPGHYAIAHYAAAAEVGLMDPELLAGYGKDGSGVESIGTESTPGVDATCGSLGQGLSVAAGMALAHRLDGNEGNVFAIVSDGEMEEGQVWEAALFSAHHELSNLIVLLDRNDSQVDGPTHTVTTLEPVVDKWRAFGWTAIPVDGHDIAALRRAVREADAASGPAIVIAHTWTLSGLSDLLPDEADGHFLKVTPAQVEACRTALHEREAAAEPVAPAPWAREALGHA